MNTTAFEVNFDGIVGPTHNYAGLSYGNLASHQHASDISNPKQAALQGLQKMKLLMDLGLKQAVLPPQDRPNIEALRHMGFTGSDKQIIERTWREQPTLLTVCSSASSMWAANAATVSPSADTTDGRVHLTPANLISQPHRAMEPPMTRAILKAIFPDESVFAHHPPLPATPLLGDEGAANHTRLCSAYHKPGLEIFTYGQSYFDSTAARPTSFPARQTREASEAIARLHQLDPARTVLVQQNPAAIDAGVFHNDVIAVGNQHVLFYHALAFARNQTAISHIQQQFAEQCGKELVLIEVPEDQVGLADAVASYLFNSQLVTRPDGAMSLICPAECMQLDSTRRYLAHLVDNDNPVGSVHTAVLRESMNNGGGPACLRLRIVLTEKELSCVHQGVLLNDDLYAQLVTWVQHHYRDRLALDDLGDPALLEESHTALDELTRILHLGSLYPFQQTGR